MNTWKVTVTLLAVTCGLVGAASAKTPEEKPSIQPPYFVDATGKAVGPAVQYGVHIRFDGHVFKAWIAYAPLTNPDLTSDRSTTIWYTEPVYFDQQYCLGNSYLRYAHDNTGYPNYAAIVKGADASAFTLYLADLALARHTTVLSHYEDGVCVVSSSQTDEFLPVVATYDWGAIFVLPLSIR